MPPFEKAYADWLQQQITEEKNHRRREILEKGLGPGPLNFCALYGFLLLIISIICIRNGK